jgi:hypothetical protein
VQSEICRLPNQLTIIIILKFCSSSDRCTHTVLLKNYITTFRTVNFIVYRRFLLKLTLTTVLVAKPRVTWQMKWKEKWSNHQILLIFYNKNKKSKYLSGQCSPISKTALVLFGCLQASPICLSGDSSMQMKIRMEQWWNDYTLPTTNIAWTSGWQRKA